jgi:CTP:phosphocholine cytidylyltransferase-like protein
MPRIDFPLHLEDKIFEIRYDGDSVLEIISYFPFSEPEKQDVCRILDSKSFNKFRTIFTDFISDDKWNETKVQIKKKFNDELFDIDNMSKP